MSVLKIKNSDGSWDVMGGMSNSFIDLAEHTHPATDITSGVVSVARGGTGATTAAAALANLGFTVGTELPSTLAEGQFFGLIES